MNLEKEIFDIALTDIMPNRFQPREIFEDEALQELSASIREHGVIQPIIVRKVGDKYEIIAGERRFRASQLAGKATIPALVRDIDDKEAAKIALLENLQRKDLTPIEEAKTYQTILKLDNITQEELAQNLGKSQSAVANKLRLLNLDEEVQTALLNSQISERHARSLLQVDNQKQKELLEKIINNRLTVRQVDEEIMRLTGKLPEQEENVQEPIIYNEPTPAPTTIPQPTPIISEQNQINQNENIISEVQNPTPEININPTLEQPSIEPVSTPVIEEQTTPNIQIEEPVQETNIFDKLRIQSEPQNIIEPQPTIINNEMNQPQPTPYDNIYDLRFAINNFRQAIQNTEKFGFKVKAEEYDSEKTYQIVITIDKNN